MERLQGADTAGGGHTQRLNATATQEDENRRKELGVCEMCKRRARSLEGLAGGNGNT